MLVVKTPEEVFRIMEDTFTREAPAEIVPLADASGRVLSEDVTAAEWIPGFDRSMVDGFAVRAADTFGCSDSLPAILPIAGEVLMGRPVDMHLSAGEAAVIPTGGELPAGADAVVMLEYTEDYGDGTVGILKPAASGENVIYKGDDAKPGKGLLSAGTKLLPAQIGALAAAGVRCVAVRKPLRVGILSTGDELVPAEEVPGPGKVRDVNAPMLSAYIREYGAGTSLYGIARDSESEIGRVVDLALSECDVVLISGGSSAGVKDTTAKIISDRGELLFHGIAMKPGKPTILGNAGGKPVLGLPGHPGAAFFVTEIFVTALLDHLNGRKRSTYPVKAVLSERIPANHGRAQYTGVTLTEENGVLTAHPVHTKSGLITQLSRVCGYVCVPRDAEGLEKGEEVPVWHFSI